MAKDQYVYFSVYLSMKEFKDLPEYSGTLPTGTTIGKKWRRHEPYRRSIECMAEYDCGHWWMGEYVRADPSINMQPRHIDLDGVEMIGIEWSRIHIGAAPKAPVKPSWTPEED